MTNGVRDEAGASTSSAALGDQVGSRPCQELGGCLSSATPVSQALRDSLVETGLRGIRALEGARTQTPLGASSLLSPYVAAAGDALRTRLSAIGTARQLCPR